MNKWSPETEWEFQSIWLWPQGKNANHLLPRLRIEPATLHVAIKAGLYHKAVQVCIIPSPTTYSPSIFRFVLDSQFELPRTYDLPIPDMDVLRVHRMGYVRRQMLLVKNANHLLPRLRIEPATLRTKIQHSTTSP